MWVIYRAKRSELHNIDLCVRVQLKEKWILLLYEDGSETTLEFETATHASQAFSYLMEAISRGDNLVNL